MLGRSDESRQDALETARSLITRGLDFNAIVVRLCEEAGLGERTARAIVAEAFRPPERPPVTLADELRAIEESLDRSWLQ